MASGEGERGAFRLSQRQGTYFSPTVVLSATSPTVMKTSLGCSRGRTESPSQIVTLPANTDSDSDEESLCLEHSFCDSSRTTRMRLGGSHGRTESPSQIVTPPANTDSDSDEEPLRPEHSFCDFLEGHERVLLRWQTSLETHADNRSVTADTDFNRGEGGCSISCIPGPSLVCTEEQPCLDSNMGGLDRLLRGDVS